MSLDLFKHSSMKKPNCFIAVAAAATINSSSKSTIHFISFRRVVCCKRVVKFNCQAVWSSLKLYTSNAVKEIFLSSNNNCNWIFQLNSSQLFFLLSIVVFVKKKENFFLLWCLFWIMFVCHQSPHQINNHLGFGVFYSAKFFSSLYQIYFQEPFNCAP